MHIHTYTYIHYEIRTYIYNDSSYKMVVQSVESGYKIEVQSVDFVQVRKTKVTQVVSKLYVKWDLTKLYDN